VNSQADIRNPLRYAALHRIKQVPIHCKLYYINSKKQQRKSGISWWWYL